MYKIPDDPIVEDEIPVKSYFKSKSAASLDETVRNHGRADAATTSTKPLPSNTTTTESPVSTNSGEDLSSRTKQVFEQPKQNRETPAINSVKSAPTSLSDAFSFIKDSEFYNEEDAEKAAEDNRKRKLEVKPASDQAEPPKKPEQPQSSSSAVIVSTRQRGNPLLAHMRNVVITYRDDILPDYLVGANTCALFLSLKYHRLNPDYIYERLRQLGKGYTVRILLILVDIPDSAACIQELTKVALLSGLTLMLAWSPVEAARYLEAFKIYENKPPEVLQGIKDTSYQGHLNGFLTSIRGVNKTDVARLKSEFGTVKKVLEADKEKLSSLPGIGDKKAGRIHDLFRLPFKN